MSHIVEKSKTNAVMGRMMTFGWNERKRAGTMAAIALKRKRQRPMAAGSSLKAAQPQSLTVPKKQDILYTAVCFALLELKNASTSFAAPFDAMKVVC